MPALSQFGNSVAIVSDIYCFRNRSTAMAPPSDNVLRRMCVGLRIRELKSELRRREKNESGKRARLVDRLVTCLRSEFEVADAAVAVAAAPAPAAPFSNDVYHVDHQQPMWGWSVNYKGPSVFLSSTNGRHGVKNVIVGQGLSRGGSESVLSDHVFVTGEHWFELYAKNPEGFLCCCQVSVVDEFPDPEVYTGYSGDRFVNLSSRPRQITGMPSKTLLCLDTEKRRLSFFVAGVLFHVLDDIPERSRVAVRSKFGGLHGSLFLRTGIKSPI